MIIARDVAQFDAPAIGVAEYHSLFAKGVDPGRFVEAGPVQALRRPADHRRSRIRCWAFRMRTWPRLSELRTLRAIGVLKCGESWEAVMGRKNGQRAPGDRDFWSPFEKDLPCASAVLGTRFVGWMSLKSTPILAIERRKPRTVTQ